MRFLLLLPQHCHARHSALAHFQRLPTSPDHHLASCRCPCRRPCPQLAAGSEFAENWEQNNAYLLALDPDNLLFNFRFWGGAWHDRMMCVRNNCRLWPVAWRVAQLPALRCFMLCPASPACRWHRPPLPLPPLRRKTAGLPAPGESYGGWEWSDSEVRGQFIGHYLSATAFAAQSTGAGRVGAGGWVGGRVEPRLGEGIQQLASFSCLHVRLLRCGTRRAHARPRPWPCRVSQVL
jgi:hypothetical protein